MNNLVKSYPVTASISIATIILFFLSSLRHWLYHSHALDLGFFDQGLYLISTDQKPIISLSGFHILADHAAVILYPLALLYWIYPDVHWLFAVQAISLTIGGLPLYHLAITAGLDRQKATTIVLTYLLYPVIINKVLFDFHPEVIAVPGFFLAVLAARQNRNILFSFAVILILSCKSVLSLTVISMGLWLIFLERRKIAGAIAIFAGLTWFLISTKLIIPIFLGGDMGGMTAAIAGRYSYLGNSFIGIVINIFTKPDLIFGNIFSPNTIEYLALLILPILWGISPKNLSPLLCAIPTLVINILSTYPLQRSLTQHYSLPILPFLFLAVISSVAANHSWLKTRKMILVWAIIIFFLSGKIEYFWTGYFSTLDTRQATTVAVEKIQDDGAVLTTGEIAPHLTHRPIVKLIFTSTETIDLKQFKYILLERRHPGWNSSLATLDKIKSRAEESGLFNIKYQQDDVYLFAKK
ncbi:MAG: DUF2079 domain-containing protein [Chamaesiphon sp.]|nr:DUF2079 domain-containing protein [Chamaesiphon sp.]